MRQILKYAFFVFTILAITACGSSGPKPTRVTTTVQAVNYLNPNLDNQAAPIVVTFYQLKSPDAFKKANFFALHNKPTETLGADLLDKREVEIRPEKIVELEQTAALGTKYIGIVAGYRNPDVAEWKQLMEIPEDSSRIKLIVNLETQRLSARID